MRNRSDHMTQLEEIEDDAEKSKEYGVNYESALLNLDYFDMCKGELVPDIMHDLLEGVLQTEVKHLLLYCTGKHFFSLDFLNNRIQSLELCQGMESDRPTPIDRKTLNSESNLLKQKGIFVCNANVLCRKCSLLFPP